MGCNEKVYLSEKGIHVLFLPHQESNIIALLYLLKAYTFSLDTPQQRKK